MYMKYCVLDKTAYPNLITSVSSNIIGLSSKPSLSNKWLTISNPYVNLQHFRFLSNLSV